MEKVWQERTDQFGGRQKGEILSFLRLAPNHFAGGNIDTTIGKITVINF